MITCVQDAYDLSTKAEDEIELEKVVIPLQRIEEYAKKGQLQVATILTQEQENILIKMGFGIERYFASHLLDETDVYMDCISWDIAQTDYSDEEYMEL